MVEVVDKIRSHVGERVDTSGIRAQEALLTVTANEAVPSQLSAWVGDDLEPVGSSGLLFACAGAFEAFDDAALDRGTVGHDRGSRKPVTEGKPLHAQKEVRMSDRALRVCILAAIVLAIAAGTQAQTYSVTDLGALGAYDTFAYALNNSTQVTGMSYFSQTPPYYQHAFFWENGQITDLGLLASDGLAWGWDINETSWVVGWATDAATGHVQPTLFHPDVAPMPMYLPGTGGEARGVNDYIEATGYFVDTSSNVLPFYWQPTGVYVDLSATTGSGQGVGEEISEDAQIVGWSHINGPCGGPTGFTGPGATLWEKDPTSPTSWTATALPNLPGICFSHAYDINNSDHVVGNSGGFSFDNPVRWDKTASGWQVTHLGSLPGSGRGTAFGINDRDEIVGESSDKAFLHRCNQMIDLNTRIPAGSGWHLEVAHSINKKGEIVGYGKLNGGVWRGFLLRPIRKIICASTLPDA